MKLNTKQSHTTLLRKLRRDALIESVGASLRLSGSSVTNEKVEQIVTHQQILSLIHQHGPLSSAELTSFIGIDPLMLNTYVQELVSSQRLIQQGKSRAARYTVS